MDNISLSISVLSIVAVTILLVFVNHRVQKQKKLKTYNAGVTWLALFKQLLTLMQQHRGLSMGYLNGNTNLLVRIHKLQAAIKSQISVINHNDPWVIDNGFWLGIQDHWTRLSNNFKHAEAEVNYDQHNRLIANLLFLIEECAENHHLQELSIYKTHSANFLWQDLLHAGEYIGQARALGTGIAAAKMSTSVQRIKLNYLISRINELIKQHNLTELDTDISLFIKTIKSDILIDIPKISSDSYFNLATNSLTKVMDKFDEYLTQLKVNLA